MLAATQTVIKMKLATIVLSTFIILDCSQEPTIHAERKKTSSYTSFHQF